MPARPKYKDITIYNPLHDNFVSIYERDVDEAIRKGRLLRIRIIRQGVGIVDPKKWKKNGTLIEKVVFRPDEPMRFWAGYVPIVKQKELTEQDYFRMGVYG